MTGSTGSTSGDLVALAGQVGPFVGAALGAYGARVLDRVEDEAVEAGADAAAGIGRRLLQLITGRGGKAADAVRDAIQDAAREPGDEDARASLRLQIRKALHDDPQLREEVAVLLGEPAAREVIQAVGERSVAAGSIGGSTVMTGDVHLPK